MVMSPLHSDPLLRPRRRRRPPAPPLASSRWSPPWSLPWSRRALLGVAVVTSLALPGVTRAQASETAQRLSAEDALALAAAQNPSLMAAAHDAAAARYAQEAEDGATSPVLTARLAGSRNERFSATSQGPTRNEDHGGELSVGVQYTAAVGTRLALTATNSLRWQTVNLTAGTTAAVTIGPVYRSELSLSATQPLLRGAGSDGQRSALRQAQARQEQANHQRDDAASALARDVLTAYWELWYAQRAVEVQEHALTLAQQQLDDARTRESQLGSVAHTDVLRFASERSRVHEAHTNALQQRDARALELARLLALDPHVATSLRAANAPVLDPYTRDLSYAIQATLQQSSELLALDAELLAAERALEGTADADQTRLDLELTASMAGLWTDDTLVGAALPGGRPAFSVGAALELELPVGGGRAEGAHQQASAQLAATRSRAEARRRAVEAEVATLFSELHAAQERIAQAGESATIADQLASAERERLGLGSSTPTTVIEAQQEARSALLRRERATVDGALAVLRIRHRTGELLGSLVAPPTPEGA